MATFTVTTAADVVNPSDGVLSLREAVRETNLTAAEDTIVFAPALEGRTLALTQGEVGLGTGVTVDGDRDDDGSRVTIDGDQNGRVLFITHGGGTEVVLEDLAITGGRVLDQNGAGIYVVRGSALRVIGCTVSGNVAANSDPRFGSSQGGALFAAEGSRVTIEGSTFRDNYARTGGAISSHGDTLVVRGSLMADNHAGYRGYGGGIALADGILTVERSAIAGNNGAAYGGGIIIRGGSASIRASTIADNVTTGELSTTCGAGILLSEGGQLALRNSTVTGNLDVSTGFGTGIAIGRNEGDAGSRLAIANSIVAGNFSFSPEGERYASDITGAIAESNGHNIFGRSFGSDVTGTVPGDLENVGPARLFAALDPDTGGGQLALNGGPTPTVRLRDARDNPALSGADPLDAGAVDQRGVGRPMPPTTNPDIGSFELDQRQVSRSPSPNNDALTGTGAGDTLAALAGNDLVRGLGGGDTLRGLTGSDTLEGGTGGDTLEGGTAWDLLRGGAGDDRLLGGRGGDTLLGGSGHDRLLGGPGADLLRGEVGRDVFDLNPGDSGVGAGRRDLVLDFALDADRIDVASIDARGGVAGDQAFAFLGTGALTGAGQLRYVFVGTGTVIQGSTDADAVPELELQLAGQIALGAGDFLL